MFWKIWQVSLSFWSSYKTLRGKSSLCTSWLNISGTSREHWPAQHSYNHCAHQFTPSHSFKHRKRDSVKKHQTLLTKKSEEKMWKSLSTWITWSIWASHVTGEHVCVCVWVWMNEWMSAFECVCVFVWEGKEEAACTIWLTKTSYFLTSSNWFCFIRFI